MFPTFWSHNVWFSIPPNIVIKTLKNFIIKRSDVLKMLSLNWLSADEPFDRERSRRREEAEREFTKQYVSLILNSQCVIVKAPKICHQDLEKFDHHIDRERSRRREQDESEVPVWTWGEVMVKKMTRHLRSGIFLWNLPLLWGLSGAFVKSLRMCFSTPNRENLITNINSDSRV